MISDSGILQRRTIVFVLFFPEKMTVNFSDLEQCSESSRHRILFRRSGALQRTSWQYEGYTAGYQLVLELWTWKGRKYPTLNVSMGPQCKR